MEIWTFHGDLDFFDLEIALRYAQDNLEIKKVLISMKSLDLHKKTPWKGPDYMFLFRRRIYCTFQIPVDF